MELMNNYENQINFLTNRNDNYNYVYKQTFKPDWLTKNNILDNYKNFDLINYRQSLINDICYNNGLIQQYKNTLQKHINISNFLQRLYFFINFNIKKPNYYKYF